MPAAWSKKDERQYKHILKGCRKTDGRRALRTCKRIAASTVNKQRTAESRTLSGFDASKKVILNQGTALAAAIGIFAVGYAIARS
jgi:hypothetical protein